MITKRLWSSLRSRWQRRRASQLQWEAEPRQASAAKLEMLQLEERILPSNNPLNYTAPSGVALAATLRVVQDQLQVIDTASQRVLAAQALAGTSKVDISGSAQNDTLTVNLTMPISVPITFTGGGGSGDTLVVTGGSAVTFAPTTADQGTVSHDGTAIQFSGVAGVSVHDVQSLKFTPAGPSADLLVDSPTAGKNRIGGSSDGTTLAAVTFANVPAVVIDTTPHETSAGVDRVAVGTGGLVATQLHDFTVKTGGGANRLTVYGTNYSLPAPGGAFSFQGGAGGTNIVEAPNASSHVTLNGGNGTLTGDQGSHISLTNVQRLMNTPARPLVIIPGFAGSFAVDSAVGAWFKQVGLPPDQLQVEPLKNDFGDLLITLQNAGYELGQSLFLAPWDWRVPVAPSDGALDGFLSNVNAASITSGTYAYAVNYLGSALVTASTTWATLHGSAPADVDLVAHSTGGLIARAYIQSAAYGASANLPRVQNLIDIGAPNQGVTKVWNILQNNWSYDLGNRLLSNIVNLGYQRVLGGGTIATPTGPISLASITDDGTVNGTPDPKKFISLYVGSLRDLLPTFDFLVDGSGNLTSINGDPAIRNNLLLDLNDGLGLPGPVADASSFVHGHTLHPQNTLDGALTIVYANTTPTSDQAIQHTGNTGVGLAPIVPLGDILGRSPNPGEVWYSDHTSVNNGDGTVLTSSAAGQFAANDPGVHLNLVAPAAGTQNNHTGLLSNPTGEGNVLTALSVPFQSSDISTGHQYSTLKSAGMLLKTFFLAFTQEPDQALTAGQVLVSGVQQVAKFIESTISNISQNQALPSFTVAPSKLKLGNFLQVANPVLSFQNITYVPGATPGHGSLSGSIGITADAASLTIGQHFSADLTDGSDGDGNPIPAIAGSVDLSTGAFTFTIGQATATVPNLFVGSASDFQLQYDPSVSGHQLLASVGTMSATITPLHNATATLHDLHVYTDGFTLGDGSVSIDSFTLGGGQIAVDNPSLSLSGVALTVSDGHADGQVGTLTVAASNVALFPDSTAFSAKVGGFSASYRVADNSLSVSADSLDMRVKNVLEVHATGLGFDLSADAFTLTVASATASSPAFAGASASVTNLAISQDGLSFDDLTLTAPSVVNVGSFLRLTNFSLTVTGFQFATGSGLTGAAIGVAADEVALFPGQTAFSATVTGFEGSYDIVAGTLSFSATDLTVDVGNILHVEGSSLGLTIDTQAQTFSLTVGSATASSPAFDGASASVTNLQISQDGLSFDDLTLTAPSHVQIGSFLELDDFSLSVAGFSYTAGDSGLSAATISLAAGEVKLFPGKPAFSVTVSGFAGSYDIATGALSLSADGLSMHFGQILQVAGTDLAFDLDPQAHTFSVTVGSATISSPAFSGASIDVQDLSVNQGGFSFGTLTLIAPPHITLGSVLQLDGFSLTVTGFNYTAGGAGLSAAAISLHADGVSILPGRSGFTATVAGFGGSYDFGNNHLSLAASSVDINFGQGLLHFNATGLSFDLNPFQVHLSTASVSSTKLVGLQGSLSDLHITSDGFSVGSVTVGPLGTKAHPITLGSVFSFSGLSVTLTNFAYSVSQGASFQGSITVAAQSAALTLGSSVSASATNFTGTVHLEPDHLGQLNVSAGTLSLVLGSFLHLDGTNIAFDTSAIGTSNNIAQVGSLTASLPFAGFSGTGKNFAIDGLGHFHTLTGFGVSFSHDSGTGDKVQWPSWLPIQVTQFGLKWQDFSAHPEQFTIQLSASVNIDNLFGTGVTLDGFVNNATIDVGKLELGQFPIIGLDGVGIEVGGSFLGITLKGGFFLDMLETDSAGNVTHDPDQAVNRYLYGGITATVSIEDMAGISFRMAFSQLGPLDIFMQYDNVQILDPDTGLALTGFHAGIKFASPLPTITSAHQLYQDSRFQPEGTTDLVQWQAGLADQVANQIKHSDSILDLLSQPYLIQGGATLFSVYATPNAFTATGDILIDTSGKLGFEGNITFGNSITASGAIFADLSQVQSAGQAGIYAYMQIPASPQQPLVTFDGSLTFQFGAHQTLPAGAAPLSTSGTDNFTVTLTGELILSVAKAADISVVGTMSLQIHFNPNNPVLSAIQLDVNGVLHVHAGPIAGNLLGVAGVMHLQVVQNSDGSLTPEAWGVFVVEPGDLVKTLGKFGLGIDGIALFEFNLTSINRPETLTIPGQAGPQTFTVAPNSADILVTGSVTFTLPMLNVQVFTVDGTFGLFFSAPDGGSPVLDALISGEMIVGPHNNPFLKFGAHGFVQISSAGMAAQFDVTLDVSQKLKAAGLDLSGNFHVDLNTTGSDVTVTIPDNLKSLPGVPNTPINTVVVPGAPPNSTTPQNYFAVNGTGNANLLNSFVLNGQFSLLVTSAGLVFNFSPISPAQPNLLLKVGNTQVISFTAVGEIDVNIANPSLVGFMSLTVAVNNGATFGVGFNGSFLLEINTTGQTKIVTVSGIPHTVPAAAPGTTTVGPYVVVHGRGIL